jgi:mono/diheme cytochrome c family protein
MSLKPVSLAAALAAAALAAGHAADLPQLARGGKQEARNCLACHSLRIVHSQRLSKAAWNRELDKMAGWGAKIEDREALLDYLVTNFGEDKPTAAPVLTQDGVNSSANSASQRPQ